MKKDMEVWDGSLPYHDRISAQDVLPVYPNLGNQRLLF